MSIVTDMIDALPFVKAANTTRPSTLPTVAGNAFGGVSAPVGTESSLNQMPSSGWVFSIIDRIASSVAATRWTASQHIDGYGRLALDQAHPLVRLWNKPNPFYSQAELIEVLSQHFELVGEMWIVVVRDSLGLGLPVELWPVRPDRIAPIPHPKKFISGYVYSLGTERVVLDVDDVIFIRRPSPTNPYRGMGVVGSIMADVLSEKAAAQWTQSFFRNSAVPGGIIEVDEDLSDADFERLVDRWRVQHQGVGNAHRVAFLERGKWINRTFSNRDIQLDLLRKLNRDVIFGAFGMPASVMGVTENVNRANAEAGQLLFNQNIVVPRLRRIQSALNMRLTPLFGDGIEFNYADPTPQNSVMRLTEARGGYESGLLTRNEARERLGESAVEHGEMFRDSKSITRGVSPSSINEPKQVVTKAEVTAEVRCPTCSKRMPVNNLSGTAEVYCRRCNATFGVGE